MNILTFDIEEWFHILDNNSTKTADDWGQYSYRLDENMDRIFQLLDKHDQKATFFCLGWVAREFPHILKRIDELGYEVATHSDMHQLAFEQNPREFENDLIRSIKSIEDTIGKKVDTYRAPGFSIGKENSWAFELLARNGIKKDCSVFPTSRSHGGFVDFGSDTPSIIETDSGEIKEFPINLYSKFGREMIFSGGGYFRLLPYFVINNLLKKSEYVMTYFHPRDFDKYQPIISDLSRFRKFKSYVGLGSAFKKLERLISEHEFMDIAEADRLVDWSLVKKAFYR